jgi:hypothetical protein
MSALQLSKQELRDLTGKAHLSRQIAWLETHGVPFQLDGKRLQVARTAAEAYLRGEQVVGERAPDFSKAQLAW